ncbi:MAG: cell division protein ZapB [Candidatus Binatia bacterium]
MALENLKLLEEKLNGFLSRHEQLRKEKEALVSRVRERDREHAALVERLQQYEQERNEMRAILEKILNRFEGLDLQ